MGNGQQQAAATIAPGMVIDERYRVVRVLGQGGNGLVHEVEHTRTGRRLAMKTLLDGTGAGRLDQEARATSLLKNPHATRILDMGSTAPFGAYLVMELLEGQSLRALLEDAGQLPLELTVGLGLQVCECLHEAHALGIIHRDLKPENVFLSPSPWPGQHDVKVLDFGVMKVAGDGGPIPNSSLTRTGSTVGTPYYMSLEQLRNSSAVDARADVYALGVVLYECLSGRKPFQAETIGDLVYALCSGPPTNLARLRPDLPAPVAEVIMRTLSANRDERPASMIDLAAALEPYGIPAFSLWMRAFGRTAAPRLVATSTPVAPPVVAPAAAPPKAPKAAGPKGTIPMAAVPSVEALPGMPSLKPTWAGPGVAPPPGPTGRRDTPTEMFRQADHGGQGPGLGEEESSTGDRDTPTRAIALPLPGESPTGARQNPMVATLKTPLVDAGESGPTVQFSTGADAALPPPASFGPLGGAGLGAPAGALTTMPIAGAVRPPMPLTAPLPIPAGPIGFGPPPGPLPAAVAPSPPPAGPPGLVAKFRAAPQNTQIIVVIVAVTAVVLVLGAIVFAVVH